MLLALSQPVNCILWPIKTQNWLVEASKMHKHGRTGCTAEWPYCPFATLCLGGTFIFQGAYYHLKALANQSDVIY